MLHNIQLTAIVVLRCIRTKHTTFMKDRTLHLHSTDNTFNCWGWPFEYFMSWWPPLGMTPIWPSPELSSTRWINTRGLSLLKLSKKLFQVRCMYIHAHNTCEEENVRWTIQCCIDTWKFCCHGSIYVVGVEMLAISYMPTVKITFTTPTRLTGDNEGRRTLDYAWWN